MTTDKYTPTDEDIRECWEEAWQTGDRSEQFTRWLAAHDAEAKAEALEEAATNLSNRYGDREFIFARAAEYRTPKETP